MSTENDEAGADSVPATSIGVTLAAYSGFGNRTALVHRKDRWTYRELLAEIYRSARALTSLGVRRGDVVAVLTGNDPQTIVLRHAVNTLGACAVLVNDGLAPAVVVDMLRTVGAGTLVFTPRQYGGHAAAVRAAIPRCRLLSLGPGDHAIDLRQRATAESGAVVPVQARPDDIASIQLSGGTTGTPKGIPRDFSVPPFLAPAALRGWHDTSPSAATDPGSPRSAGPSAAGTSGSRPG